MEPFDINRFSGWNVPQRPLSLSRLESDDSLSMEKDVFKFNGLVA